MSDSIAPELPDDLKATESQLLALLPRADLLDRDRLMYAAGEAASRSTRPVQGAWRWPLAFGGMTAVAASLLAALLVRQPQVMDGIVDVAPPAQRSGNAPPQPDHDATTTQPPLLAASQEELRRLRDLSASRWPSRQTSGGPRLAAPYLDLRDQVLALGLDSWVPPRTRSEGNAKSPAYSDLLESVLEVH